MCSAWRDIISIKLSVWNWAGSRLVHLDVEDYSEELFRQQSYAIKNQLAKRKTPPTRGILFAPRWFFMA